MSRPDRVRMSWPESACTAWGALPVEVQRHARALGLDYLDRCLLLALESFRRGDGDEAVYPAQETLSELCGCSVRTIEKRVAKLRDLKLIEVERRRRPGGRRVNHYTRHGLGAAVARLERERPGYPSGGTGRSAERSAAAGTGSYPSGGTAEVEQGREQFRALPRALGTAGPDGGECTRPLPHRGGREP